MSTVAITGAGSGIGAATAARLERDGHTVIGVDIKGAAVTADLSTTDGCAAAIDAIGQACGGVLDGLVTCAGLMGSPSKPGGPLAAVNYFGTVDLLAGLRPLLAASSAQPSALAISSNSTTGQPHIRMPLVEAFATQSRDACIALADEVGSMDTYPASKMAVARWVRKQAVSDEWIGAGIRLNAIAPGMIETPMVQAGRDDPGVAPMLELFPIPAGRPGRAEEIAALITFLLGPESTFFVGSVVFADGGTDALLRPDDWPSSWEPDTETLMRIFSPKG